MTESELKKLKEEGRTRIICQIEILYDKKGHRCGMAHVMKTENDLELLGLIGYIKTMEQLLIDDINYPYEEEQE